MSHSISGRATDLIAARKTADSLRGLASVEAAIAILSRIAKEPGAAAPAIEWARPLQRGAGAIRWLGRAHRAPSGAELWPEDFELWAVRLRVDSDLLEARRAAVLASAPDALNRAEHAWAAYLESQDSEDGDGGLAGHHD